MTLDQAILLHRQAVEEHKQACVNQGLLIEEVAETNILFWKKLHKQNVPTIDEMSSLFWTQMRHKQPIPCRTPS